MLKDRFALWPSRHRVAVALKSLGERLHDAEKDYDACVYRGEIPL